MTITRRRATGRILACVAALVMCGAAALQDARAQPVLLNVSYDPTRELCIGDQCGVYCGVGGRRRVRRFRSGSRMGGLAARRVR